MEKDDNKKIAVLEERIQNVKEATILQAKEYERRLEMLNNEARQLKEMQSTYLPRELYETKDEELNGKIESLQKLVYIGLGGVLVLEMLLKFFMK